MQRTINTEVSFADVGLHTGRMTRLTIRPAAPDTGVRFIRTDLPGQPSIAALWNSVRISPLCTKLDNGAGVTVSTIEHLMAALAGLGIHNAEIRIDGPEVPILDGSALPFIGPLRAAGLRGQDRPLMAIEILRRVHVREGEASASLSPAVGFSIDFRIDFPDAAIGRQSRRLDMRGDAFIRTLCDSRTFCRAADVETMRRNGLAQGGSIRNAVVVEGDHVLTPGGLRRRDEPVRHKMLDAVGDLATAGAPILGAYTGIRAGHNLTNRLLRALFADAESWRLRPCDGSMLPGSMDPRSLREVA